MAKLINLLVSLRHVPIIGKVALVMLKLLTLEIPKEVRIGRDVKFQHLSTGLVIHPNTTIEDNVQIFQGVTIGRADAYKPHSESEMEGIFVKNGAILCAGAKILCKKGTLIVGENTIIGANAVLLQSTGDNEIWVGNPAMKVKNRDDNTA